MYKKAWLALFILALGGCRIVSQQELANLQTPPNPHMSDIDRTWQDKIVPQIVDHARPADELMKALRAAKDFDSACQSLGYRSQSENPCIFYVSVVGKIENINTASRSGKMTLRMQNGDSVIVQTGPILRGTLLRDSYKGASYADFNDQVLFGEYGRAINERAVKMIQAAQLQTGETTEVIGIFSAWDIPTSLQQITPAKITRAEKP
ncbi:hypothetical protein C7M52_00886 [Mixta theicola]|nr:DUF2291 domain-containing protein [Mixta theicola]QHM74942.1 hypothetical protein C7M52_00886 [Mixta theicola]